MSARGDGTRGRETGPLPAALAAVAIGLGGVLLLRFGRGFFWSHAVISGLAVTALVYSAWRTWVTLRGRGRF